MYSELMILIKESDINLIGLKEKFNSFLDKEYPCEPREFILDEDVVFLSDPYNEFYTDLCKMDTKEYIVLQLKEVHVLYDIGFSMNQGKEYSSKAEKLVSFFKELYNKVESFIIVKLLDEEDIHQRVDKDSFEDFFEMFIESFKWGKEEGLIFYKNIIKENDIFIDIENVKEHYSAEEMYNLGVEYSSFSYKNDEFFSKAESYFLAAIGLGHDVSNKDLGNLYLRRYLTDNSQNEYFEKAEKYFKAVELDDEYRKRNLGLLYFNKWVCDKSKNEYFDKAEKIYLELMSLEYVYIYENLFKLYLEKIKEDNRKEDNRKEDNRKEEYFEKAKQVCEASIENFEEDFYIELAGEYYRKWLEDETKDYYLQKSLECYCCANDLEYLYYDKNLDFLTVYDNDNQDSVVKAERYYLKGVEFGYEKLYVDIGNFYFAKWEVEKENYENSKNFQKAEEYFQKAIEVSDIGFRELGNLYLNVWREDKTKNEFFDNAVKFYDEAFEKGSTYLILTLSAIYFERWLSNKTEVDYYYESVETYIKAIELEQNDGSNLRFLPLSVNNTDEEERFEVTEKYLKKCLELGCKAVHKGLGILYYTKWEKDISQRKYLGKADHHFKKAMGLGDSAFNYKLGTIYSQLASKNKDFEDYFSKAEECYIKASEYGSKEASNELGALYQKNWKENPKDLTYFEKAENLYLKEIKTDNTRAANDLGVLYTNKWVENKIDEVYYFKAEKYLLLAIQKDDDFASENLGTLYFRKWESNKSSEFYFKKVIEWYIKGAIKSSLIAKENLGYAYYSKWLEDKSKDIYFKKAEERSLLNTYRRSGKANNQLGLLYHEKWEDNKDIQYYLKAQEYYQKAKELQYPRAYNNLGFLYFSKWEEDKTKTEYFHKAEENMLMGYKVGDELASNNLGNLYFTKWETENNRVDYFEKAERYYLESINRYTDVKAYFNLGHLYVKRWRENKVLMGFAEKAVECYSNALNLGFTKASNNLKQIKKDIKEHEDFIYNNGGKFQDIYTSKNEKNIYKRSKEFLRGYNLAFWTIFIFCGGSYLVSVRELMYYALFTPMNEINEFLAIIYFLFSIILTGCIVLFFVNYYINFGLYFELDGSVLIVRKKNKIKAKYDLLKTEFNVYYRNNKLNNIKIKNHKNNKNIWKTYNMQLIGEGEFGRLVNDIRSIK